MSDCTTSKKEIFSPCNMSDKFLIMIKNQTMNTPFLKSYYRRKSTYLTSEQIETIRSLKDKVPKYRIMRDFYINEHRVDDIWKDRECQPNNTKYHFH